jgi:ParB family transcriptional regulator, chromosome partitioning protein
MSRKRPALGRGLGALLPSPPPPEHRPPAASGDAAPPSVPAAADRSGLRTVPIEHLRPSPDQPRKRFEEGPLDELAASIRAQGIIQPIVVAPLPDGSTDEARYLIIAGERRWRAAQRAGLHEVPVVVRHTLDQDRLELALIENIQRADLNPIEEARAFAGLIDLRDYTQEQLAERVGKDRTTITNALRLLRLPERVQDLVREGRLSMGHARALLGLPHERDMTALAAEVVRGKLSVRATERAVRNRSAEARAETGNDAGDAAHARTDDDETRRRKIIVDELETRLRRRLGVRVRLKPGKQHGAGTLEIPYQTLDELDRLLQVILDRGSP